MLTLSQCSGLRGHLNFVTRGLILINIIGVKIIVLNDKWIGFTSILRVIDPTDTELESSLLNKAGAIYLEDHQSSTIRVECTIQSLVAIVNVRAHNLICRSECILFWKYYKQLPLLLEIVFTLN